MDRAYEGDDTRQLALDLGYIPVVPPKADRLCPWEYDRVMYRRRNEVERLFRRLKGFRRVFSRFDKVDVMFAAFVLFALIVEALRISVNSPQTGHYSQIPQSGELGKEKISFASRQEFANKLIRDRIAGSRLFRTPWSCRSRIQVKVKKLWISSARPAGKITSPSLIVPVQRVSSKPQIVTLTRAS
jgi:hypothetical protein